MASSTCPDFSSTLACSYNWAGSVASCEKDAVAMAATRTKIPVRKTAFTAPPLLRKKVYRMLLALERRMKDGRPARRAKSVPNGRDVRPPLSLLIVRALKVKTPHAL